MSRHPTKVRIKVLPEAWPVIDFLQAHHYDIGTINTDRIADNAPPEMRSLCVALADRAAVDELAEKMAAEITEPETRKLVKRVGLMALPLDTILVIFLDIAAIEG